VIGHRIVFTRWSAVAIVSLLVLVGCSGSEQGNAASDEWTSVDETFVATMIPHHHLGMTLIDEATRRSGDVRLRHLVFEMSSYHMSDLELLHEWSSERSIPHASEFPGDLPASEVQSLADYEGLSHDIVWLDLMIRHHVGAVSIADATIAAGSVAELGRLATETRRVQSAEIDTMKALLGELCAENQDSSVEERCQ